MAITATYVSASSFTVVGDRVDEFSEGRRVECDCDTDGLKYGTIKSSSYSNPDTTINLTLPSDDLTANLIDVLYGIQSQGADGSVPVHNHGEGEGAGGNVQDNVLINQDFSIWQEEETFTNPAHGVYTADGYYINNTAGGGASPTINIKKNIAEMETGFGQCCELEITNVGVSDAGRYYAFQQKVEDFIKYRGKTVTLSIRMKASTPMTLSGRIYAGTTSENITSLGTSYTTFTVTGVIATDATLIVPSFYPIFETGTFSSTGSIYIQWMKLELGSVATPLIPESTEKTLEPPTRNYQKSYAQGVFPGTATEIGAIWQEITAVADADHTITIDVKFPKVMKAAPTVKLYDLAGNADRVTMAAGDNIAGTVSQISDSGFKISATNGASATSRKIAFHYTAISRV